MLLALPDVIYPFNKLLNITQVLYNELKVTLSIILSNDKSKKTHNCLGSIAKRDSIISPVVNKEKVISF